MVVSTGSTTVLFIKHRGFFGGWACRNHVLFINHRRVFRWLSSSKPRPFYQTPLIFRWLSLSKPHSFYQTPQVFPVVELVETTLFFINHRGFFRWLSLSKPPFLSTIAGFSGGWACRNHVLFIKHRRGYSITFLKAYSRMSVAPRLWSFGRSVGTSLFFTAIFTA